ncbi:MAG: S1 RNA-binding domain-containing protein [Gemmataceae bacterium]
MSDQEKPVSNQPQPAPAAEQEPARKPGIRERFGKQPKPMEKKVPSLEREDMTYGFGTKPEAYDADIERQLERELQDAMGGADMQELVGGKRKQAKKPGSPETGPRKGKVMSVRGKDVFIDVGGRIQGVMAILQFGDQPPKPGDEVEVHIEGYDPDGLLILAKKGAAVEADWNSVTTGMIVEARVTAQNKGGLSVEVNSIRGFMPISQIEMFRIDDLAPYVNQRLKCMVTEVDREERNLVVSRRAVLEQEREENREKLWGELAEGQIREGTVRQVKPFGAFVDLGGADGLLPVGEMSWQRVNDPAEIVQPGQRVRVVVLRIDRETRKLTLGLRQLTSSPWDSVTSNYVPGSVVRGKVTRLMDFGAFVELEPGVEGLVHLSELAPQRVNRVGDVVKVDQEVVVKVLNVDTQARRISLSIKAALKAPEPAPTEVAPAEAAAEEPTPPVKIRKVTGTLRGGVGAPRLQLPMPPSSGNG